MSDHNAGIKTNYTKSAQTVSFDLRPINPIHDPDADSEAFVFAPVIRVSAWLPQDCSNEKEKKPGMSFLCARPVGHPRPLTIANKWYIGHLDFIAHIKSHFKKLTEHDVNIVDEWNNFSKNLLPESQSINDYCFKMGSRFTPPLGEYLYGPEPFVFFHLQKVPNIDKPMMSRSFSTSFADGNIKRASLVDKALQNIVRRIQESIEWRGNLQPLIAWKFDAPEMCTKVIVDINERFNLTEEEQKELGGKYRLEKVPHEGTIVSFCKNDFNFGDIFQVSMLMYIM